MWNATQLIREQGVAIQKIDDYQQEAAERIPNLPVVQGVLSVAPERQVNCERNRPRRRTDDCSGAIFRIAGLFFAAGCGIQIPASHLRS